MDDLFNIEAPPHTSTAKSNSVEFSVSEISHALKRTVEDAFGHVRVRGEISGYRGPHASGHAYFSLKDDKARIEAVIWRGVMRKLKLLPEEGMEVIVVGKLTTYPGSSKYQVVIESFEPAGAGALMALLEERKKKLKAEGLFDSTRKQALPFMPRTIGVVTSPTGAVIRDILHRISDRFPLHIIVWPVRVQGENSGSEVAHAIRGFHALDRHSRVKRPDIIIVARGGGSLEDLWGFNDESVVRAVADSTIPVISAVGHETDWTLIDLAADQRAPTPTGAAELAVPVQADLVAAVASLYARLKAGLFRLIDFRRQRVESVRRALPSYDQLLAIPRRRFDEAASRLARALAANTGKKRLQLVGIGRPLSPSLIKRFVENGQQKMRYLVHRSDMALVRYNAGCRQRFNGAARSLNGLSYCDILKRAQQNIKDLKRRADMALLRYSESCRQNFNGSVRLLDSLSYHNTLERGFVLALDHDGQPVKRAAQTTKDEILTLQFCDDSVHAVVDDGSFAKMRQPTKSKKKVDHDQAQGTLL